MSTNSLTQPCCVCLTLCNEVVEDVRSHNKSIFSIFNGIGASQLPTMYPRLSILASVTNAEAGTDIKIAINLPSGQEMISADGKTIGEDKTSVTDFPLELQGVVFPEAGVYMLALSAGGELIAQRPFNVFVGAPQQPAASA